jgi:hypothetical protein
MAESRIAEQRTFSAAAGPLTKVMAMSANKKAEIIDRIGNPLEVPEPSSRLLF